MNKMQNERNDVEQPCPHCGQDLRLPPDAYERLEAAAELSRTIEQWDVHDAVAHDGHLQAGIEWATWTWLRQRLAALAAGGE